MVVLCLLYGGFDEMLPTVALCLGPRFTCPNDVAQDRPIPADGAGP